MKTIWRPLARPSKGEASLTGQALTAIEGRCQAASCGPWYCTSAAYGSTYLVVSTADEQPLIVISHCRWPCSSLVPGEAAAEHNASFIANAREDLPLLLEEVTRLRQENEELRRVAADARALLIGTGHVDLTTAKVDEAIADLLAAHGGGPE